MPKSLFHIKNKQSIIGFLESRREITKDNCWLYTGYKDKYSGYGLTSFRKIQILIHRLSLYAYTEFELDSPFEVLHSLNCLNKSCFNPDHLRSGTTQDNMMDKKIKDRANGLFHCGHPREGNTRIKHARDGDRDVCIMCARELDRFYYDRDKLKKQNQ